MHKQPLEAVNRCVLSTNILVKSFLSRRRHHDRVIKTYNCCCLNSSIAIKRREDLKNDRCALRVNFVFRNRKLCILYIHTHTLINLFVIIKINLQFAHIHHQTRRKWFVQEQKKLKNIENNYQLVNYTSILGPDRPTPSNHQSTLCRFALLPILLSLDHPRCSSLAKFIRFS